MIAFPFILAEAADKAGMKRPENPDDWKLPLTKKAFPHFAVFCSLQLGVPMHPGEHWTNAEAIAKIPDDRIKTITLQELKEFGFASKGVVVD